MRINVYCPSTLYLENATVQIKRISSTVTDGTYIACIYNDNVIGMCDEEGLEGLSGDDYLEAKVLTSTTKYDNTILELLIE